MEEVVRLVNVALGSIPAGVCLAGDADGDGSITVDEIVTAVNRVLEGCGGAAKSCGGIAQLPCAADEACDLRDASCAIVDLAGVCAARPGACPRLDDPVCGCDGATYANDCFRLAAGAVLARPGPCR